MKVLVIKLEKPRGGTGCRVRGKAWFRPPWVWKSHGTCREGPGGTGKSARLEQKVRGVDAGGD